MLSKCQCEYDNDRNSDEGIETAAPTFIFFCRALILIIIFIIIIIIRRARGRFFWYGAQGENSEFDGVPLALL